MLLGRKLTSGGGLCLLVDCAFQSCFTRCVDNRNMFQILTIGRLAEFLPLLKNCFSAPLGISMGSSKKVSELLVRCCFKVKA